MSQGTIDYITAIHLQNCYSMQTTREHRLENMTSERSDGVSIGIARASTQGSAPQTTAFHVDDHAYEMDMKQNETNHKCFMDHFAYFYKRRNGHGKQPVGAWMTHRQAPSPSRPFLNEDNKSIKPMWS
jgi:hypothetical protein